MGWLQQMFAVVSIMLFLEVSQLTANHNRRIKPNKSFRRRSMASERMFDWDADDLFDDIFNENAKVAAAAMGSTNGMGMDIIDKLDNMDLQGMIENQYKVPKNGMSIDNLLNADFTNAYLESAIKDINLLKPEDRSQIQITQHTPDGIINVMKNPGGQISYKFTGKKYKPIKESKQQKKKLWRANGELLRRFLAEQSKRFMDYVRIAGENTLVPRYNFYEYYYGESSFVSLRVYPSKIKKCFDTDFCPLRTQPMCFDTTEMITCVTPMINTVSCGPSTSCINTTLSVPCTFRKELGCRGGKITEKIKMPCGGTLDLLGARGSKFCITVVGVPNIPEKPLRQVDSSVTKGLDLINNQMNNWFGGLF